MDYETKLLLTQLIDAVNNKSVDWWLFGITTLSAFLSLVISYLLWKTNKKFGDRQNKLIAQQNQIERFRIYHELHRDLFKLSNLSKLVLPKIYDYFTSTWGKFDIQEIKSFLKEFEELNSKLRNEEADYILHFGANNMMNDAVTMVYYIEYILANVLNRKLPKTANQNKFIVAQRFANMELTEPEYISYIHKIVNDDEFRQELEIFVQRKNELFVDKNNIIERVRAAYNAD
ncbi:MAG: hypothetical protein J1D86_01360 [Alistipes sp.]|nr:hypothetical protein [Alistipes sp.]